MSYESVLTSQLCDICELSVEPIFLIVVHKKVQRFFPYIHSLLVLLFKINKSKSIEMLPNISNISRLTNEIKFYDKFNNTLSDRLYSRY